MAPEMTPEQALAKLQEIKAINEEIRDNPDIATMLKHLTWLLRDRIEQLKAIANQK